jgi:chromosomal replication initiation ATPase DnaA
MTLPLLLFLGKKMTETYLQKLQREHKERRARFAQAAKKEPIPEPIPAPSFEEDQDFILDPKNITFRDIFRKVCKYYKVSMLDIISARRSLKIVLARHVIAYIASQHTELSISQIASRLGGRDKSTIMHSILRVKELANSKLHQDILAIKRSLNLL